MSNSKPVAVLISDVHYSLPTLEAADAAMRQAISKANELGVPLIVAGDLHDTKANLRAECVNHMLETFSREFYGDPEELIPIFILRGNHDSLNERSIENSAQFLSNLPRVYVINKPIFTNEFSFNGDSVNLIPYYHNPDTLRAYLSTIEKHTLVIMHQGIQGSDSGEYIQDHSAITKEDVQDFRVISGHYHTRQEIKTGRPRKGAVGLFSYVGNPFTLNFGEANDPEKGFQVLMDDGSLEFVPTNLRKHVVYEVPSFGYGEPVKHTDQDLIWVKVKGPKETLSALQKKQIAGNFKITQDFRLTLEPTDEASETPVDETLADGELLDHLIDNSPNVSAESKERLKSKWKTLLEPKCESSQPQPKTSVATKNLNSASKTKV